MVSILGSLNDFGSSVLNSTSNLEYFPSKTVIPSLWLVIQDFLNILCLLLPKAVRMSQSHVRSVVDLCVYDTHQLFSSSVLNRASLLEYFSF